MERHTEQWRIERRHNIGDNALPAEQAGCSCALWPWLLLKPSLPDHHSTKLLLVLVPINHQSVTTVE